MSATAATEMLTIERGRGTGPIANHRSRELWDAPGIAPDPNMKAIIAALAMQIVHDR